MESKGYFSGDTYKTNDAMKAICNLEMFDNISLLQIASVRVSYQKFFVIGKTKVFPMTKNTLQHSCCRVP